MSEDNQGLSIKAKKWIFGVIALVIVGYFVTSSKDESTELDYDPHEELAFDGPQLLMGKWMGSNAGCLKGYTPNTTQTFTFGQGYIQAAGKPTMQKMVPEKLEIKDVHPQLVKHLDACGQLIKIEEPVWFSLTLKRQAGDKVMFWYGQDTDELPKRANGYLFDVTMNGITVYEKYKFKKIKAR